MNKTIENKSLNSSLEKLGVEVRLIYSEMMDNFANNKIKFKMKSCEPISCFSVEEIFDKQIDFEVIFMTDWPTKTVSNINSGITGLILDELGKDNIFSQIFFEKFFSLFNSLLSDNKTLKEYLTKKAIEEIGRIYKNKYKLIEIKEVYLNFVNVSDDSSVPDICLEIKLERENDVSKLV